MVRHRLALARDVAAEVAATEPVAAAIVVGSTALRRCSERADLDLVLIGGERRFESRTVDGVRVELEWLSRDEALAKTAGTGWVWELREAARLGCGVPVLDPEGLAASLAARAAAMTPAPDRFEATLRDVYLVLVGLGRGGGDADAVRGCLDNVVLLTLLRHPRRYQKPKWALADLLHAGEAGLAGAVLAAYGAGAGDPAEILAGAHDLVDSAYDAAGLPPHEAILAMGHAPHFAQASYVSRCLDDAGDLHASGRGVEAQYVARFAARLVAGLVTTGPVQGGPVQGGPVQGGPVPGGVVDALAAHGGDELAKRYLALFDDGVAPGPDVLEAALAAADACREAAVTGPGGRSDEHSRVHAPGGSVNP